MKKNSKVLIKLLIVLMSVFFISGCGKEYEVTFIDDLGNIISSEIVKEKSSVTPPTVPTYENRVFTGWSDSLDNITSNKSIKALYEIKTYSVKFIINDEVLSVQTIEYNGSAVEPTIDLALGQVFLGWDQAFDNITSDKTISGQYQDIIYTVNFYNLNKEVIKTLTCKYNDILEEISAPVEVDMEFMYWSVDNIQYDFTDKVISDLELYPVYYNTNPSYQISYDLDGGYIPKDVPYETRNELINDILKDLGSFVGSTLTRSNFLDNTNSANIASVFSSTKKIPGQSVSYKDKWRFLYNYLLMVRKKDENYSSTASFLADVNNQYASTYWRFELNGFINSTQMSSWPYSSDYTIDANANGYYSYLPGEIISVNYSYKKDTNPFTLFEPLKNYYHFSHWIDQDGNKINEISGTLKKDLSLKAIYEIDTYTISYELDGGIGDLITEFQPANGVVNLSRPVKPGYAFVGYYLNSNYTSNIITKLTTSNTKDLKLYARFVPTVFDKTYTISVYGDSISTYSGLIPTDANHYYPVYSQTVKNPDLTWWRKTMLDLGLELVSNVSYSGSTVSDYGSGSGIRDERISKIEVNGEAPDFLLIYLGINDVVGGVNQITFENNYQTMIDKIKVAYPDTVIFLATLPYEVYTNGDNPDGVNEKGLRDKYNVIIEKLANTNNLEILAFKNAITEATESVSTKTYLGDNIHPNVLGMEKLATIAKDAISEYIEKNKK